MAEWTICPSCQLKHSLRSDGLCPRCHQPVEAGTAAGAMEAPPFQPASPYSYPPPAVKKASPVKWVLIATVAIVVLLGLGQMGSLSGRHLLFKFMYGLDGEPVSQVDGKALPYHMTLASANKWYLRSDDSAHRDNADADRWLVCPEKNAHVVTIVEEVALESDQYVDMDKLVNLVIDNMRKNVAKYTVHQTNYISRPIGGRLIHGTAEIQGLDVELYHAVFIDGRRVYQVLAFSEKKNFAEMSGELDRVIQTMRLP
jgi:hypothetical protein